MRWIAVCTVCIAWVLFILNWMLTARVPHALTLFGLTYPATVFLICQHRSKGQRSSPVALFVFAGLSTLVVVCLWFFLIVTVEVMPYALGLTSKSSLARFLAYFLDGVVRSAIVGVFVALPFALLFRDHAIWVCVAAVAAVFWIQGEWSLAFQAFGIAEAVVFAQTLMLILVPALFIEGVRRLAPAASRGRD